MLAVQKSTTILKAQDGLVRLCEDTLTGSWSIGLRTESDMEWKYISKKLHDLLVKELSEQKVINDECNK